MFYLFIFTYNFLPEAAVKFENVMANISFWDSEVQMEMWLKEHHMLI